MNDPTPPFAAPVGTHDVLGPASAQWEGLISRFADWTYRYGFSLVLTPIFEDEGVFSRGIGEGSDVFRKEMYVFEDRGKRRYALRPEGTASVVRAFVQHRPTTPWKAWYVTPAFRYERPQKGRYRQHHQLGVEVIGTDDPAVDVEVIALADGFYRSIGLERLRLLINSMGHGACRAAYLAALSEYLEGHELSLCDEHRTQWRRNALRVLDCKRPECVTVTDAGPFLVDWLCEPCRAHFDAVVGGLAEVGISGALSPRLVRGFDYYTRTTFEFVSDALDGAQNAVGGGGRYDGLTERLGGPPTSGVGFGSGVERLLLARTAEGRVDPLIERTLDVFVVDGGEGGPIGPLVERLRRAGLAVERAYDGRSLKAQMKVADRSGARLALLVGTEGPGSTVTIRDLRASESTQQRVPEHELVEALTDRLTKTRL